MIDAILPSDVAAVLDLHACGLTLADQWGWIVAETMKRSGLDAEVVEADLHALGFTPTGIELADDEVCDAIVAGAVRRLDGVELPHNHVAVQESYQDMAARIAARLDRMQSGATPRDRALAEISFAHGVDAFVASRALGHFGRLGVEGGPAAVNAANLFIVSAGPNPTEH